MRRRSFTGMLLGAALGATAVARGAMELVAGAGEAVAKLPGRVPIVLNPAWLNATIGETYFFSEATMRLSMPIPTLFEWPEQPTNQPPCH